MPASNSLSDQVRARLEHFTLDDAALLKRAVEGAGWGRPSASRWAHVAGQFSIDFTEALALCHACGSNPDEIVGHARIWTFDRDDEDSADADLNDGGAP